jgi:UDP-N-acetylmuramate dehydrogenase
MFQHALYNLKVGRIDQNVSLASLCSFRVGGRADLVVYPKSTQALESLLTYAQLHRLKYKIWGNGTNILPSDNNYSGLIIKMNALNHIHFTHDQCHAQAGASLIACAYFAAQQGLSGLEFSYGIPATVGGAIVMNAGAYQAEIFDVIESIQVYRDGTSVLLHPSDLQPTYRNTRLRHNDWVVLGVTFKLQKARKQDILTRMEERKSRRQKTQPLTHPNAGSIFKNFEHIPAWQAIEQCGLRGFRIGGAVVSEKHSNFILNDAHAHAQDVRILIEHIQHTVRARLGLELHTEIEYFNF